MQNFTKTYRKFYQNFSEFTHDLQILMIHLKFRQIVRQNSPKFCPEFLQPFPHKFENTTYFFEVNILQNWSKSVYWK